MLPVVSRAIECHVRSAPLTELLYDEGLSAIVRSDVISNITADRIDIIGYLGRLVKDGDKLRNVMLLTDTFLAGSRAVDFFTPGMAAAKSDWDFYCCGTPLQRRVFLEYMLSIGYIVGEEGTKYNGHRYPDHFCVLTGTLPPRTQGFRTQIIAVPETEEADVVSRFHSSILWCYISGAEAVYIEPFVASGRLSTAIGLNGDAGLARSKYVARKVTYLDPAVFMRATAKMNRNLSVRSDEFRERASKRTHGRVSLDDEGTLHIEHNMLSSESWMTTLISERRRRMLSSSWIAKGVRAFDHTTVRLERSGAGVPRIGTIPGLKKSGPEWEEAYTHMTRIFASRGLALVNPSEKYLDVTKEHLVMTDERIARFMENHMLDISVVPEKPIGGLNNSRLEHWVMFLHG